MRINYSDEEDFPGQAELWQANCDRSLKGKKGQAALRELHAALLALPDKKLIAEELENKAGEVCAIGALAKFKGKDNPMVGDSFGEFDELEVSPVDFARELGVPRMVAIAIVSENDDGWRPRMTPEGRYQRMLTWTQSQLSE